MLGIRGGGPFSLNREIKKPSEQPYFGFEPVSRGTNSLEFVKTPRSLAFWEVGLTKTSSVRFTNRTKMVLMNGGAGKRTPLEKARMAAAPGRVKAWRTVLLRQCACKRASAQKTKGAAKETNSPNAFSATIATPRGSKRACRRRGLPLE